MNILYSNGLNQTARKATRIQNEKIYLIDDIFINQEFLPASSGVIIYDKSDH
jgi:hypothetical protein